MKDFHSQINTSVFAANLHLPVISINFSAEEVISKKLRLDVISFFVNAIVEFEEWLTASIIWVGEVWKLFCGLRNQLRKALLFFTKDLNGPSVFNTSFCMEAVNKNFFKVSYHTTYKEGHVLKSILNHFNWTHAHPLEGITKFCFLNIS